MSDVISPRLADAIELAVQLHGRDSRKQSPVPVLAHLLAVCSFASRLPTRSTTCVRYLRIMRESASRFGAGSTLRRRSNCGTTAVPHKHTANGVCRTAID